MLDQTLPTQSNPDTGLLEAFLNPLGFAGMGSTAVSEIVGGTTHQIGNEIDEFVTGQLRDNLLGLPLDLAALNITRGRETGLPSLNMLRNQIFSDPALQNAMPGDTALKQLVLRLRQGVRQIDLVGRLGGEEFVIVLPAIPPQPALLVAERLRAAIAAMPVQHESADITLTISIGVAMARTTDRNLDQVLARADGALYEAKGSGRNCLRSADPPLPA